MARVRPEPSGIDPVLIAKASAGNPDAQFRIGVQYELGAHVTTDPAQAVAWYRRPQTRASRRRSTAWEYFTSTATASRKILRQAAEWYRKAAAQGFAPAQFSLGLCYAHGNGVPQDFGQALAWYEKAAQQNDSDALLNLAYLYHNGQGVPKDDARSFDLVRKAAEAGSPDAQFNLGMAYFQGDEGLQADNDLARKWLARSAQQGDVAAQFNYAMLLKTQPDKVYFWLGVAAPHLTGETKERTMELRTTAAARLSPAQKAEIDQQVKVWRPVQEQP